MGLFSFIRRRRDEEIRRFAIVEAFRYDDKDMTKTIERAKIIFDYVRSGE